MRAVIVERPKTLVVRTLSDPVPGPYEVLTQQLFGGICAATDRHLVDGELPIPGISYPLILGHEAIGRVLEVGGKVRNLKVGDLITRTGAPATDGCAAYWGGFAELGLARDFAAMRDDGAADADWQPHTINRVLPPGTDPAAATMMITWRETLSYLNRLGPVAGKRLLIIGSGGNGFYVLTINVTRQKQAAAALLRAQKMEALGQLSSGIAHDFNNLLTVILGNLKPLEPHVEPELRQEMLEPAIRAARRGADLTRRLLAVARRHPLEPSPVDIAETAHNIARLVKPSLPDDARISVNAADTACFAFVDPAQFETSLLNLAVNARDALSADGRIDISVSRQAVPEDEAADLGVRTGDYIKVRIADNGIGMSSATMDKAFDPFFSTKDNHDRSGLGLTLVQRFAQDSQGIVRLESREHGGSEFTLLLPACEAGAPAIEEPMGQLPKELTSGLVLLVDDDSEVRSVLRRDLVGMGCRLIEARSAPEAFELLQSVREIALVLTDIAMPGAYSGVELARRISQDFPDVKIVLMTGFGREGLSEPAADLRILQKPFGRRTLMRAFRDSFARTALPR